MAQDRIRGNTPALTHDFLSIMVGVRRAGVAEALQSLAEQGLIKACIGQIVVLNRKVIERHARGSHGVPKRSSIG
jgi:hypothetical protein